METKSKIESLLRTILFVLFVMVVGSESMAKEKILPELKEFKITIEKTDDGLKMHSDKGSAWINLSFSLKNNKPQAIDEYGMTKLGKISKNKDPKLADYLFTIAKTKKGISLTGIEGTAWKELSFLLQQNGKQSFDQFGMTQ